MTNSCRAPARIGDFWALAVVVVIVLTAPMGVRSRALWVGDETRDAAIADAMARTGDFLHPKLAGHAVPEKPFFFYALVASSYRLARQVNPLSTRLPAVLFSAATLAATAAAGRRLFSRRAGFLAAAVLSTTYLFVVNAHDCIVDVALGATVALGLAAFLRATSIAGFPRWDGWFGSAVAASILAKGLIGPALLLILTLSFPLIIGSRRRFHDSVSLAAIAIPAGSLLFWVSTVFEMAGLEGLKNFLWVHQFGRFLGLAGREFSHHRAPFWFYLLALPGLLFPWSLTLPAAAWEAWKRGRRDSSAALFAAIGASVLFLSLAGTKRTIYFFPVVPIASLAVAGFLDRKISESRSSASGSLRVQAAAIGAACALVALVPAWSDRRISPAEGGVALAVSIVSTWLFVVSGGSQRRLVGCSLCLALVSLVILDRFSLPRIDRDGPARDFFARVQREVGPDGTVYAYRLNEDVLGRACLDLHRPPVAEDDWSFITGRLRGGAYLLAEVRKVNENRASEFVPLASAFLGGRAVALYSHRQALTLYPRDWSESWDAVAPSRFRLFPPPKRSPAIAS